MDLTGVASPGGTALNYDAVFIGKLVIDKYVA